MGQKHSVSQWFFLNSKDDSGNDCAVLLNPASGTVLELCATSTGWFSFMDRSDQAAADQSASNGEAATKGMRGKFCPGVDASFEYRSLTAAPRVLDSLRSGFGEPLGDGWRLGNVWSAMQEDAPLILQCRASPELRLVLTADGFIFFPADPAAQVHGMDGWMDNWIYLDLGTLQISNKTRCRYSYGQIGEQTDRQSDRQPDSASCR